MIRKDVVIAVLATFCLTATLFMITTSKSQSGVGEYNPWADYNGDGVIDIFDIVPGAVSFGATSTDTAKLVTIGNHTTYEWTGWMTIPADTDWTIVNDTLGYRQATIYVQVFPGGSYVKLNVQWFANGAGGLTGYNFDILDLTSMGNWGKTYDVPGSELHVVLHNFESVSVDVRVGIYLTM